MPPAASLVPQCDRTPMAVTAVVQKSQPPIMATALEAYAKDAIIAWFRGEFAAANAIIDALCGHLTQLDGGAAAADYESAFAAIHRRRLNWIPILQMQKYYSIADVTMELKKVAEKKREESDVDGNGGCTAVINEIEEKKNLETPVERDEDSGGEVVDEDSTNSNGSEDTNSVLSGSQEMQHFPQHVEICTNHEECESRLGKIKMTKGFVAKEPVRGRMVNVVRGLKLYENIFSDIELSKLNDFVNELRVAGQNGQLSGETFISYNQQTKGNKRELIQLGVSIFGQIKQDATNKIQTSYIEPIPPLIHGVIEHFIQWGLIPENRKPNSCIINFFDSGEYSQPFLKPPHLDQPLSTLLLSQSTMAFGRTLVSDGEGNFRGPLMLSLKEGSLLVMRGNSSDTSRHVMCTSPDKRVSITFFRVRTDIENAPNQYAMSNIDRIPKWGVLRAPVVIVPPVGPMVMNCTRMPHGGTGVFLPWNVGPRKPTNHLPPRAQRGRFLALPSPAEPCKPETTSDSGGNSP